MCAYLIWQSIPKRYRFHHCLSVTLPFWIQFTSNSDSNAAAIKTLKPWHFRFRPSDDLRSSPPELLITPNWGELFFDPVHDPWWQKIGEC